MRERILTAQDARLEGVEAGSLDRIVADIVLDQFPSDESVTLLRRWNDALTGGGTLELAVTDFDKVCDNYKAGTADPERTLTRGGLAKSIYNRDKVLNLLNISGFEIDGGSTGLDWKRDPHTIAVRATKRLRKMPSIPMKDIHAMMSLPRVSWTETMGNVYQAVAGLEIPFTKSTGVFWSQSLQRMMQGILEKPDCPKYILTIDFDSIFDQRDIIRLWQIMEDNPDIFALCPLQIGRDRDAVLMTVLDENRKPMREAPVEWFRREALDIGHGHFGLTLIRTEMLRKMSLPWFVGQPNANGEWGEGRIDDDIYFWKKAAAQGLRICASPKVRIGHLQLVISWPDDALRTVHQYVGKFYDEGRPQECMTY